MLGYEPPQPKLWKAVVGAALVVFPVFYLLDLAFTHHRPGRVYLALATGASLLFGYQMYSQGPAGLRPLGGWRGRWTMGGVSDPARSLLPKNNDKEHSDLD